VSIKQFLHQRKSAQIRGYNGTADEPAFAELRRAQRGSTLALIGLGAVLGYLAFYTGGRILDVHWYYCLLGLGLVAAAYWSFTKESDSFKSSWLVLLLPCYALFQFFTISIKPAATFDHFLRIIAYTIIFITVRNIAKDRPWAAAMPLIIVAGLEASIGLIRYFYGTDAAGGAHGTYTNRDHFAGLLEMALPLSIMGALKFKWLWVPAAIIFTGIVCSFSRGAFLSTLCAFVLIGMIVAGIRLTGRWKAFLALPLVIGAFILFVYLPPDLFFRRSENMPSSVAV
jgi:hypothetical protein